MDRLKLAAELRAQADKLERENSRLLPDRWKVGQRVRFIRSCDWGFTKGGEATIVSLSDENRNLPADEYQVFHTSPDSGRAKWWTTPDDVELIP